MTHTCYIPRSNMRRGVVYTFLCVALFFSFTLIQLSGCATVPKSVEKAAVGDQLSNEGEYGIKILSLRRTAAGYMLDLRIRVLDPEKAASLLRHYGTCYVIVEKSGAKLHVPFFPKIGSVRSTVRSANMIKKDRNYVAIFANPGRYVKAGDKVTLVMGDLTKEHMEVQ